MSQYAVASVLTHSEVLDWFSVPKTNTISTKSNDCHWKSKPGPLHVPDHMPGLLVPLSHPTVVVAAADVAVKTYTGGGNQSKIVVRVWPIYAT